MCKVLGPVLPMNLFWSLMLANVPLVITASLPLRAPYELNSRGVRLTEIRISDEYPNTVWHFVYFNKVFFFFFFGVDQILPLLPDLKLTVCSAGTWLRRWPWQCCPLVRCDLLSRCFRGTVRRERSLLTEGPEHLYSEMHRDTRVSVRNPTTYSKLIRRDSPTCWKTMVSVYTWTWDPRGKPPNLDTQRCSRTRSLSGQTTQRWLFIPVKAGGC